jgi:hypothetical protein
MGFSQEVKSKTRTIVYLYKLMGDEDKLWSDMFYKDIADLMGVEDFNKVKKFVTFN